MSNPYTDWKVGEVYVTGRGDKVRMLYVDAEGDKPLVIQYLDDHSIVKRYRDGRMCNERTSPLDLLPPSRSE